jgi:hypothetical protein
MTTDRATDGKKGLKVEKRAEDRMMEGRKDQRYSRLGKKLDWKNLFLLLIRKGIKIK